MKIFDTDQLSVMILAGVIMALAWGCKREAVNVVTDRVIEDVSQTLADGIYRTDEFTEKAISDWIDIPGAIVPSNTIRGFHGETTSSVHTAEVVIEEDFIQYIVTNGVIAEVVEEETYVTATNIHADYSGYIEVYDDIRWIPTQMNILGSDTGAHSFRTDTMAISLSNRVYEIGLRDDGVVVWRKAQ